MHRDHQGRRGWLPACSDKLTDSRIRQAISSIRVLQKYPGEGARCCVHMGSVAELYSRVVISQICDRDSPVLSAVTVLIDRHPQSIDCLACHLTRRVPP
jgi:hypothetical protein